MITFNPDKFGFYRVGERTSYSKFEAAQWCKEGELPEWDFNQSTYDKIDWKVEPETDLWTLYKMRAKQIRENYDYIVLWYSGGSDSHNLLHAFLDANVKFDEIATTWNYEQTGEKYNHQNAEISHVVLPDIKTLKDAGLDFKFRLIDISELTVELFKSWGTEFEYNVNFHFSPNNPAKHLLRDKIEDYKNLIAAGKKVCFVWGKEKPFVLFDHDLNKHYVSFCDNVDNCVGPYVQRNYHKGWYDEFFYWTPDFPLITLKQAHVIKNFVNLSQDKNLFVPIDVSKAQTNGYSRKFNMYLNDEALNKVLYPKWSSRIFSNGKTASFTYSERDRWFFKSKVEESKRFMQITNTYFKLIDPSGQKGRKKIYPLYSSKYWIE
jgi:hypothetical protein